MFCFVFFFFSFLIFFDRRVICTEMQIPETGIVFLSSTFGSVVVEAGALQSGFETFSIFVLEGRSQLPVRSLTAAGGPTIYPPSSGLPLWAIIVIAVVGLALLAALITVVVCCCVRRRRNQEAHSIAYVPLR